MSADEDRDGPDGTHVAEWTEVRLTGQPPGSFPPYDFTFRSDTSAWASLPGLLEQAAGWERVEVAVRHVRVETITTLWTAASRRPPGVRG